MFDRIRNLSQSRQIALIAAGAGVLGVLFAVIWLLFLHVTYQPLFSRLRTSDAATIVAELEHKKIPYRLSDGGTTIEVPADAVDATRLSVMSEDLPLKGTVGFELFNKSDMGITDFAQKINYQRALQGELERTIMTLDGVDTARVHLSLGEDRIFRDDRVPPKASVTVRMAKGVTLTENAAQGIRRLVAAAVPNLDNSNVVILDEQGRVVSAAPRVDAGDETYSPQGQEKHAIAQFYEARIRQGLDSLHLANIGVSVVVDNASGASGQQPGADLTGWTPATRLFPLQVTLSPSAPLDAASQDNVRTAVIAVIGTNIPQDDVITFGAIADALPALPADGRGEGAAEPTLPRSIVPPVEEDRSWLWEAGLTMGLLFMVFVAVFVVLWRMRRPGRLSDRQRAVFAARLRLALEQGGERAASHS